MQWLPVGVGFPEYILVGEQLSYGARPSAYLHLDNPPSLVVVCDYVNSLLCKPGGHGAHPTWPCWIRGSTAAKMEVEYVF